MSSCQSLACAGSHSTIHSLSAQPGGKVSTNLRSLNYSPVPFKAWCPTFDPATGNFNPETPFTLRSNPNLQPEDSRAFSGGLVYTPKFVSGLTITIDLFDIESKGRVNSIPNPSDVISRVFEGRGLFGENVFRDAQGNIISIEGAFQNAGSQKARGADFGIQYQRQTPYGIFTSLTQATYTYSFEFAGTPDVPEKELVSNGGFFGSGEAFLRWKGYSRLDWSWKNFDLVGTVNYRDGFHETNVFHSHIHYVKQTWFFDGQASYRFHLSRSSGKKSSRGLFQKCRRCFHRQRWQTNRNGNGTNGCF